MLQSVPKITATPGRHQSLRPCDHKFVANPPLMSQSPWTNSAKASPPPQQAPTTLISIAYRFSDAASNTKTCKWKCQFEKKIKCWRHIVMNFKWVNNLGLRSFKFWGDQNDTMTHLPEFLQFFFSKKIRGDSVIEFLTSHDSFHQIVDGILMTRTIACLQAIKTESLISKVSTPNALSLFSIDWTQVITVKHGSKFGSTTVH